VPSRIGVAALMGLAILSGAAFAECERLVVRQARSRSAALVARSGLAALLAAAIYWNYAAAESQIFVHRTAVPSLYRIAEAVTPAPTLLPLIRRIEGPLLELPVPAIQFALDPSASPEQQARAMYRSIYHWRPLLNGYNSFWPIGFPERMTLANRLPDRRALAELRSQTGLKTILVHTDEMRADQRAVWLGVAGGRRRELRLVGREGDDLLFEVIEDSG